ncbi:MAG TPA: hypothetical protein VFK94_01800 [Patescibacteria group bacterium]|nr:hypothetical protein [Patescibacteria group bacterium]
MKKTLIASVLSGIVGIGIGASTARNPEPISLPEPTPRIVIEQGPEPSARVEIVEKEVTPEACQEAILYAYETINETLIPLSEIFAAYVDYPDENLGEFGSRVEDILTEFGDASAMTEKFDQFESAADGCK